MKPPPDNVLPPPEQWASLSDIRAGVCGVRPMLEKEVFARRRGPLIITFGLSPAIGSSWNDAIRSAACSHRVSMLKAAHIVSYGRDIGRSDVRGRWPERSWATLFNFLGVGSRKVQDNLLRRAAFGSLARSG
jgi:hypothetical protein